MDKVVVARALASFVFLFAFCVKGSIGGADGMYRTYCFAAMTGFEMSNSGLMSGDTRDGIATYGITFGAPLLDTAEQLITLTVIALQGVIIQGSSGQASVKAGRYQGIDNSLQVWRYSLGVEVPFILPSPPVPYIPFKGGTVYQTLSPRIEPTETVDPRSPAPPLSSPILIVQAKPEESGDDN